MCPDLLYHLINYQMLKAADEMQYVKKLCVSFTKSTRFSQIAESQRRLQMDLLDKSKKTKLVGNRFRMCDGQPKLSIEITWHECMEMRLGYQQQVQHKFGIPVL